MKIHPLLWLGRVFILAVFLIGLDAASAKRVALVIGNAAYQNQEFERVSTAGSDARLIARTLTQIGFDQVTVGLDMDREEMLAALATFASDARGADAAIIYYAGHGFVMDGQNRLVPVNARLSSVESVPSETISMNDFVAALDEAAGLRVLVLDAARARPAARQRRVTGWQSRLNVTGALASLEIANVLILYSAKAGSLVAAEEAGTGTFAELLAAALAEPGLDVRRLFSRVREDVLRVSGGRQEPFVYGTLSGDAAYLLTPTPESSQSDAEAQAWTRAAAADSDSAYSDYLRLFPEGRYWIQAANLRALRRAQRIRVGPVGYGGRTINVAADGSGDYPSLREAVEAAQDNDRVVLGPGRYASTGLFITKSILITGPRRGSAVIDFTSSLGLSVRATHPYANNRRLTRDPTTAVESLPQPWIERVELRCACGAVSLQSGRTTMREVRIIAIPEPERVTTGINLSSAAELSIVDSYVETTYSPIRLDGGFLTAVGNRLRMISTDEQAASKPVISGTMAFGLATLVENRLEGVGLIGFFMNTGPYLFSNNEMTVRGVRRGSYILFGLMSQAKPIVVRGNRVRIGHGRAQWVECSSQPCTFFLEDNRGLSQ
jgi:Caspase domain